MYNKNTEPKTNERTPKHPKNLTKNLLDIITLELLETRPMHGYEIMVTIRKNYGINFGPSTIYPILTTLEKKQYLKCTWNMTGERPRKIYELTTDGKALLTILQTRLRQFVEVSEKPAYKLQKSIKKSRSMCLKIKERRIDLSEEFSSAFAVV